MGFRNRGSKMWAWWPFAVSLATRQMLAIAIRKLLSTTDTNDTGSTDERYDAQLCQSQRALQSR